MKRDRRKSCNHNDYDINLRSGRAKCNVCGRPWDATDDEIGVRIKELESKTPTFQQATTP